jgi:hypothetical protein
MGSFGPIDTSLLLIDTSAGRGAGQPASLKAGAFVSLTVLERLSSRPGDLAGTNGYLVRAGSRVLEVRAARLAGTVLEPGTKLRAKVESNASGGLALRLLPASKGSLAGPVARNLPRDPGDRQAATFAAAGLPNDSASRTALAALLGESARPDPRALARVRRAALRDSGEGGLADMAAKMEAKGIRADADAVDELIVLSDARSGGEGGGDSAGSGGSGSGGDSARGERELPVPAVDLSRGFRAEFDEDDLPRALGDFIRCLASRSDSGSGKLALFNHLRGKEGSWVILPFRFALDEVDFSGSFRIQLPYLRGGQGRFEAFFSASRGLESEDWSFFVSFGGAHPSSLRLVKPKSAKLSADRIEAFAAELAVISCSLQVSERELPGSSALGRRGGFDFDA